MDGYFMYLDDGVSTKKKEKEKDEKESFGD